MLNWILSASLLILVVIALRYLLRGKLHPAVQYALWGLVLLRLLLPFTVAHTTLSLSSAVERTTFSQDMERLEYVESVERDTDGTIIGQLPTLTKPDGSPMPHNTIIADSADDGELSRLQNTVSLKNFAQKILRPVWYIGMGLTALWFLVVNIIFTRSLRRSREKVDCGSKRPVYVTAAVDTPCLYGLLDPAIYVTPEVLTDEGKFRHVLTHETMHYRHGDHVWSLLRVACLCLHWYNPLVWWAAALSRRDAELCCDAAAIKSLGEEQRGDYGRTLIGLSCQSAGPNDLLLTATTMTGGKRSLRERIKLIAKKPQTKAIVVFAVAVVAVLAAVITFTGSVPDGNTIQGNNRAPWIKFRFKEDISHVTLVAEEYQDGILLDVHRETLASEDMKNLYPTIDADENGQLQLNLRIKGKGGDFTEQWSLFYNSDWGGSGSGSFSWFNELPDPMSIRAGDRVCLLSGNYQTGDDGSHFVDPMFFTDSPSLAVETLENIKGYSILLWAEFGGPAVDYGVPDEDGWVSTGITGERTRFWTPTNVPTVQTSTFTFENLQAATLRISHYQKGKLMEQQELPFTGLDLYGMALHQKENTWTAIASAYHDRHGGEDDWISISFPAEGQVYLSSYCDDSNTNNFVLSPSRTYYLAAAAWGNIAFPPQDYQTNPDLIDCAEHLLLYELDVYASGDALPETDVTVWSDKQMDLETYDGLGAVYNFSQLNNATLCMKHYQKGKLVDEQSCAAEKMKQLTVCAYQDENIGKWRVLALDAGGVNYSPTPRQGEAQEWRSPNAVVDRDDAPGFSGDWLPLVREGAETENVVTILSGGNTYCFAAFAWGVDRDYYCEEYLSHPEFLSKPEELVLLELELP